MVRLRRIGPIFGESCKVELVLPKDGIPGFLGAESGTFKGELNAEKGELELTAENLEFAENRLSENGLVYLTVDSY